MRPINENMRVAQAALRAKGTWVRYVDVSAYFQLRGLKYGTAAVGHWFTGRSTVPVNALRHLADILQISVEELIKGDPAYVERSDTKLLIKLFEGLPPDKAQAFLALAKTMENPNG